MEEIKDNLVKEENEEPKKEEIEEDKETASKSNLTFYVIIGVIVILFVAVFAARFFIKQKVYTMDEMIARTLQGEENPETNYKYNGYVFVKVGTLWYTQWQLENYVLNIPLHYGPLELEDVKAEGKLDERFNSNHYYITFDPYGNDFAHVAVAAGEIGRNLVEGLGAKISSACLSNHTVCADKPIITCNNTDEAVIFIKESEEAKIVMEGNCLILQGQGTELFKVADRAILSRYGIMK